MGCLACGAERPSTWTRASGCSPPGQVLLRSGWLHCRAGRLDEARAELSTAAAMLREMEMAFWLPEAEGELAKVT